MGKTLHISLAQINPIVGDLTYNQGKILKYWQEVEDNSDLIIFPELSICGYPPEDLVLKPSFIDAVEHAVNALCQATKNFKSAAIIGAPWRIDGKLYNCALMINGGKVTATIAKHHLPNYSVFDERRIFASGPLPEPIDFNGTKLGLMVCEDMWFEDVSAHLKAQGAELLIIPNGSPFENDKTGQRMDHASARAKVTGLPLFYVNQVGGQDELVFDGNSFVLNADGLPIMEAPAFEEDVYGITIEENETGGWFCGVQDIDGGLEDLESIYLALIVGLRDYVKKNNFPGVLLGLSGGVDSALTAVIAADALGPEMVHAVMLPSQYTSNESLDDAKALAKNLGISLHDFPIGPAIETLSPQLTDYVKTNHGAAVPSVTEENMQSRMRGLILMALSNTLGYMLLSTGNKSEMAVGYATLYGDMNGGFNALKDVYKTQVYALCEWRNQNKPKQCLGAKGQVMPQNIITKAPTAELKDNQTDQDTLPEYEELDAILHSLIEEELSLQNITAKGFEEEVVLKVWNMLDRAEYKRRQAPPGIKITSKAFGRDRRYPITNHFVNMVEKTSQ